jgi:NAD(P)-dependent dehydrogenase (short-subunit alcohol dehydrogenase family)
MNDFAGKVALVTGTTGIGRAVALRLLQGGGKVLAAGIDPAANADLERHAGNPGLASRRTDVSDPDEVEAAVNDAATRFGGLDIIVNAAAVHPFGDVVETDIETWNRCLAVNLTSVYLTAHYGVPLLRQRGGGAIVNLSSVQGHACQKRVAAYATSKGAVHTLTRAMALDLAAHGIRVNSVSPGSVRTPMLAMAARTFDGPQADVDATFRRFGAAHPLGRIGEPEEVAELVAFLASARSGFCTGADYLVDGGLKAGIGVA